jgi:hypothetical protein
MRCVHRESDDDAVQKKRCVSSECVCGVCMVDDAYLISIMLNVMSNMR